MKKLNLFVALFAFGMGSAFAQPTINAVTPGQLNISTVALATVDREATSEMARERQHPKALIK
jgi:hypothetical protein